jgi:hypothetical protein
MSIAELLYLHYTSVVKSNNNATNFILIKIKIKNLFIQLYAMFIILFINFLSI